MTAVDMAADGSAFGAGEGRGLFPEMNLDGEFILRSDSLRRRTDGTTTRRRAIESRRRTAGSGASHPVRIATGKAPQIQGFEVAGISAPAEMVGGDYFDFLVRPMDSVFIALGDVAGHGPAAAMMMAVATGSLRTAFWLGGDVGMLLTRVNAVLEHFPPRTTMMTMMIVELEPATRTFHYASAAHPFGYLINSQGTLKRRLNVETDVPLGIVGNHVFETSPQMTLEPGEAILIVSDGVLESGISRHHQFGEPRLLSTVEENYDKPVSKIVQSIVTAAADFRGRKSCGRRYYRCHRAGK